MPRADAATPDVGFLHEHPNFVDLLRQLAQQTGIATYLIEKDYWLMHGFGLCNSKAGNSSSRAIPLCQKA